MQPTARSGAPLNLSGGPCAFPLSIRDQFKAATALHARAHGPQLLSKVKSSLLLSKMLLQQPLLLWAALGLALFTEPSTSLTDPGGPLHGQFRGLLQEQLGHPSFLFLSKQDKQEPARSAALNGTPVDPFSAAQMLTEENYKNQLTARVHVFHASPDEHSQKTRDVADASVPSATPISTQPSTGGSWIQVGPKGAPGGSNKVAEKGPSSKEAKGSGALERTIKNGAHGSLPEEDDEVLLTVPAHYSSPGVKPHLPFLPEFLTNNLKKEEKSSSTAIATAAGGQEHKQQPVAPSAASLVEASSSAEGEGIKEKEHTDEEKGAEKENTHAEEDTNENTQTTGQTETEAKHGGEKQAAEKTKTEQNEQEIKESEASAAAPSETEGTAAPTELEGKPPTKHEEGAPTKHEGEAATEHEESATIKHEEPPSPLKLTGAPAEAGAHAEAGRGPKGETVEKTAAEGEEPEEEEEEVETATKQAKEITHLKQAPEKKKTEAEEKTEKEQPAHKAAAAAAAAVPAAKEEAPEEKEAEKKAVPKTEEEKEKEREQHAKELAEKATKLANIQRMEVR